jgi:hypothetical protein
LICSVIFINLKIGNYGSTKGVVYLRECLFKNKFLKKFYLDYYKIDENDDRILEKFLNYNYTIEIFNIPNECIYNSLNRNINLHRFIFYNFNLNFDLFLVFV